jgi:hypothetical protein
MLLQQKKQTCPAVAAVAAVAAVFQYVEVC